ncbi:V-type ATP synthase subunit E [Thermococcus atlanticus]
MEGAQLIIEEINREAEQKINYILNQAKEEAEKIRAEAERRARARAEWILRKAQTQAEIEKQRIIAGAKLEVRKKKLALQEELIGEVLKALREKLMELPEEEYYRMLVDLTVQGIREINEDRVFISSNKATLELIERNFEDFAARVREKFGRDVEITLGEEVDTIGGVLIESPERTVRVDNRFEARMERLRSELRAEIAGVLFG